MRFLALIALLPMTACLTENFNAQPNIGHAPPAPRLFRYSPAFQKKYLAELPALPACGRNDAAPGCSASQTIKEDYFYVRQQLRAMNVAETP